MLRPASLCISLALIAGLAGAAQALTDKDFISDAIKGDNAEISLGELGMLNSGNDAVKSVAQMLINDHLKTRYDAETVAMQLGVPTPLDNPPDAQKQINALQNLSGKNFDEKFVLVVIKDHQKTIAEFKREAGTGKGPARDLAARTLPTLEKHLQMAKSLYRKT